VEINGYTVAINTGILHESGLQIESLVINGTDDRMGMLLLSEEEQFVLRIYLIIKEKDYYYLSHELLSFSFLSRNELLDFRNRLPKMTALEILYWMNPAPQNITHRTS
jgi:hypothetical protein